MYSLPVSWKCSGRACCGFFLTHNCRNNY